LFGLFGLACGGLGTLSGMATLLMKLVGGVDMTGNPLLLLTSFALLAGLQFIVMGMLGEIGVRTYYESQGKRPYAIRTTKNFEQSLAVVADSVPDARAA